MLSQTAFSNEIGFTHYLAVGGGYNASGSQVVLELNTKWFQTLAKRSNSSTIITLFGSGTDLTCNDIVTKDEKFTFEEILFSSFFHANRNADCSYHHNSISDLTGPATRIELEDQLQLLSDQKPKTLRFYFTGHGSSGRGDDSPEFSNNVMDLWNDEQMNVQELTSLLDQLAPETHTQIVMVQCFSGGFSQINFAGGKLSGELTSHNRCGFFSQLKDRFAAGCTPDLKNREEYSPYFFSALSGTTEGGRSVNADYNRDGRVTSNEAHAFVIISEDSIDVPITTSSQLLRDLDLKLSIKDLKTSWSTIRESLRPEESAIVDGLIKTLSLKKWADDDAPHRILSEAIGKTGELLKNAVKAENEAQRYLDSIWSSIKSEMLARHPTIESAYAAFNGESRVASNLKIQGAFNFMKEHPLFSLFAEAFQARDQADNAAHRWEKRKVKLERLSYLIETKLFEQQLALAKNDRWSQKYSALRNCESESFFNGLAKPDPAGN